METKLPPRCASRFRLERALAEGGFGSVYLATQIDLDRPVALKVLQREMLEDDEHRARFLNEARVAATLSHPHIVKVLDHDVEDGLPWIAYEYLPGRTLEAVIDRGAQPVDDAVSAASQIASALEYAHARDVLHRDIKPANVLEDSPGHYKMADFGIAKWTGTSVRTRTGFVVGTPAYLAPEMFRGQPASRRTEVYALGVILYQLLTGEHPFKDNLVEVFQAITVGAPRPASVRRDIPAWLDELVTLLIAPDPAHRIASMPALLRALERREVPPARWTPARSVRGSAALPVSPSPRWRGAAGLALVGIALAGGAMAARGLVVSPGTPRASASAAPARPSGPVYPELAQAKEAARRGWLEHAAERELLNDRLLAISPELDLARAAQVAAGLAAAGRPELERLERLLTVALGKEHGPGERSGEAERELADAAAHLAVHAMRLDYIEKVGQVARRLSRDGDVGLTAITSMAEHLPRLRYDLALLPAVERAVRLSAAVIARAARSGQMEDACPTIGQIRWVAGELKVSHFPGDAQVSLERLAERLWREAGQPVEGSGKRLVRVAEGMWNLGRQSDGRLLAGQRALLEEEMRALGREVPALEAGLADLSRTLRLQGVSPKPSPR